MRTNLIFHFLFLLFLTPLAISGDLEYDLFDALNHSDLNYAKDLLKKGADVHLKQEPFKQTPIIIAPLRGIDFVTLLVENGANVNDKDQDNNTALINASFYGKLAIVQYLIEKGADIQVINNDGLNALDAAIISKNKGIIQLLKSHHAQPAM